MRGFEFLDNYHKSFTAGRKEEYVRPEKTAVSVEENEEDEINAGSRADDKVSLTDKIKSLLTKMFEIEDQKIS